MSLKLRHWTKLFFMSDTKAVFHAIIHNIISVT